MGSAASVSVGSPRRERKRPETPTTSLILDLKLGRTLFSKLSAFSDENNPPRIKLSRYSSYKKDIYSYKNGSFIIEYIDELETNCPELNTFTKQERNSVRRAAERSKKRRFHKETKINDQSENSDVNIDTKLDICTAGIRDLKRFIETHGQTTADCLTKRDLRDRAQEIKDRAQEIKNRETEQKIKDEIKVNI